MAKIKLMTDSACDITREDEAKYNIRVIPFALTVGEDGYYERVDFTPEQFWEILNKVDKIPATSQITPMQFVEEYKQVCDDGFSELIYVSINSKGSATYNNSIMAREMFFEKYPEKKDCFKIHLVDSLTYTMGYGYAVLEAAKKAARGASSAEILSYLDDWFASVEIYFAPYTLEFAKKSGRISCAAAFVGELMGLKPIISIINGEMDIVKKVRGEKAVIPAIISFAKEKAIPATPHLCVYGTLKEEGDKLCERALKELKCEGKGLYQVGAAIAINAGPKVVALIVKGQNRKHKI